MIDSLPNGCRIGYARESTDKQEAGLAAQKDRLNKYGCTKVFEDLGQSGASNIAESEEWARLMSTLKPGDELVVTSQSRLGRKSYEVTYAVGKLIERGVVVTVLDDNRTYSDLDVFEQNLMLNLSSSMDHQERVVNRQRQAAAYKVLKAAGVQFGRKPILTEADAATIKMLASRGLGATSIGKAILKTKKKGGEATPVNHRTVQKVLAGTYVTQEQWERSRAEAYARLGVGGVR